MSEPLKRWRVTSDVFGDLGVVEAETAEKAAAQFQLVGSPTGAPPGILAPSVTEVVWYTADNVRAAVDADRERLFAPYAVGRPPQWIPDQRTRDLLCVGNWLTEELRRLGVSEDDRRTQQHFYNRWSRSVEDLFELGARTLNTVLDGKVEQNRVPHRRWG
jgi:hypothetical protein